MYQLYIANKNYSSWSLRPWVLMRARAIPFEEHLLRFGDHPRWDEFRRLSPSGKVPCLKDGETVVWDSLAIVEYLAEHHPGVWPATAPARAWARSAAAEMHSGFAELRSRCSMNCGVRIRLHERPAALTSDLARLAALWQEGLQRFGGPYLAGETFTAVDAFFAPVAFRIQTYALELARAAGTQSAAADAAAHNAPAAYAGRLLELDAMRDWYDAALAERFRDAPHEAEIAAMGTLLEDLRAQ
jgi:glutathione S-transferase